MQKRRASIIQNKDELYTYKYVSFGHENNCPARHNGRDLLAVEIVFDSKFSLYLMSAENNKGHNKDDVDLRKSIYDNCLLFYLTCFNCFNIYWCSRPFSGKWYINVIIISFDFLFAHFLPCHKQRRKLTNGTMTFQ